MAKQPKTVTLWIATNIKVVAPVMVGGTLEVEMSLQWYDHQVGAMAVFRNIKEARKHSSPGVDPIGIVIEETYANQLLSH